MRVEVVDDAGKPLTVTRFDVDVRFEAPFNSYDFSYEATASDNRLFFLPAPVEYPATLSVTPQALTVDAPLVLTNEFVWTAPADNDGVIKKHTFTGEFLAERLPAHLGERCWSGCAGEERRLSATPAAAGRPMIQADTRSTTSPALPASTRCASTRTTIWLRLRPTGRQRTSHWRVWCGLMQGRRAAPGWFVGLNSDWSRFYVLGIGSNGKYWLSKNQGGAWTSVAPRVVTDKLILNGENRLKLVSQGSRFTIYLNDHLLTSVDDGASHSGVVGLYAEGMAGFDARFRNIKLWNETITGASETGPDGDQWSGPATPEWLGP